MRVAGGGKGWWRREAKDPLVPGQGGLSSTLLANGAHGQLGRRLCAEAEMIYRRAGLDAMVACALGAWLTLLFSFQGPPESDLRAARSSIWRATGTRGPRPATRGKVAYCIQ